ncbi:MAG: hypothetical protein M1579_05660 [Gammaproteobacteria bacterium]|nr:hypothetical protein [Gammaproteobacteria bacterium]
MNRIIEAQELSSIELTTDSIEHYTSAVDQWKNRVLDTLLITAKSQNTEEQQALKRLDAYSLVLIERLNAFLRQLHNEQQQFVKQNFALSAYSKAR